MVGSRPWALRETHPLLREYANIRKYIFCQGKTSNAYDLLQVTVDSPPRLHLALVTPGGWCLERLRSSKNDFHLLVFVTGRLEDQTLHIEHHPSDIHKRERKRQRSDHTAADIPWPEYVRKFMPWVFSKSNAMGTSSPILACNCGKLSRESNSPCWRPFAYA